MDGTVPTKVVCEIGLDEVDEEECIFRSAVEVGIFPFNNLFGGKLVFEVFLD